MSDRVSDILCEKNFFLLPVLPFYIMYHPLCNLILLNEILRPKAALLKNCPF